MPIAIALLLVVIGGGAIYLTASGKWSNLNLALFQVPK